MFQPNQYLIYLGPTDVQEAITLLRNDYDNLVQFFTRRTREGNHSFPAARARRTVKAADLNASGSISHKIMPIPDFERGQGFGVALMLVTTKIQFIVTQMMNLLPQSGFDRPTMIVDEAYDVVEGVEWLTAKEKRWCWSDICRMGNYANYQSVYSMGRNIMQDALSGKKGGQVAQPREKRRCEAVCH